MAYLDEHQSRETVVADGEHYKPSESEEKDIKLAEKLFAQAKKYKSKYDEPWNDDYNMYRGRQWKELRPSYRHSEVINLIFREIQAAAPLQLDSRPKFEFLPTEPSDFALAKILNQVCESDWTKYNWTYQLAENIYDGYIFGTGIAYLGFDQKKEKGLGAICLESEDIFWHFPDPKALNFNNKMKWHIKAEPMALSDIKAKWENGKFVKSDIINIQKLELHDQDKVTVRSPVQSAVLADNSQQYSYAEEPQAMVLCVYIDGEYEIEETKLEEQSEAGEISVKYVQSKKHPNGRKFVIANKVWLEGEENQFEDGKVPYARYQNYINQRQFWGISDIEQLKSPQKVFNKLISFALDVLTLMGNPIWKVGAASGVDTENLFNQPGLIIEADDISQIQREEGVQLQPYVLQLIDRLKLWFDDVSGSSDVSRGMRPEGITAASAIQSLQEASLTRIRQKARNLDAYLQDLGQMYVSRVFQHYTAPRIFRLTNDDGSYKFFKFHVEQSEDGQKIAKFRPYEQGEDGQMYEGEEQTMNVSSDFDVKVNTGTALPFAKAEREQKAYALFDRKIIDAEEVLKSLDYPNWQAVLSRAAEQQAQMAAQAQAAQGQPPA